MDTRLRLAITVVIIILFAVLTGGDIEPVNAQAGGRPILLVYNDSATNEFGRYLGEILRAEGLNSFNEAELSSITSAATLTPYKVVILAETPLTAAQAGYFVSYANDGGYLIAMRPDAQIKGLFGLNTASGPLTDGYLKMNGTGTSQGLNTSTLQIHGDTERYTLLGGAVTIAELYVNATTPTNPAYPAVVSDASGHGIAFLYDLAKNVVYTRQGNPDNGNDDTDGDGVLRTVDLFQASGGGAPWVDLNKVPIPQADEQQRLFARLVQQAVHTSQPMPQLWYFPGTAKTMLIPTGDAHANPYNYFETLISDVTDHDGKITIYLTDWGMLPLTDGDLMSWVADGHSFGIHPTDQQPPLTNETDLETGYASADTFFDSHFSVPRSRTVRNHQVAWVGWTDAAELAVQFGMAMDTNFYHWGEWLQKPDTSWAHGYITGSGQPMKFMKDNGTILPYYQQLTQLVDEQFFAITTGGFYENEELTIPQALDVTRALIDASLDGDYAAIMTQFHVDYSSFGEVEGWVTGTLDYAVSKNVPIWNADEWLTFTETRHEANYTDINWNAGTKTLSFSMDAPNQPTMSLSTILPLSFGGEPLYNVTVNSIWTPYTQQTIKGVNVAFVSVPAGDHNFVVRYSTPPPPPTSVPSSAPLPNYQQTSLSMPLTWNRVSWAEQYQIQIATNAAFSPPVSLIVDNVLSASTLSTTITLPQEGTYYWHVRAKHPQSGWRAWSAAQRFTIDIP